jgi:hypothetical protein
MDGEGAAGTSIVKEASGGLTNAISFYLQFSSDNRWEFLSLSLSLSLSLTPACRGHCSLQIKIRSRCACEPPRPVKNLAVYVKITCHVTAVEIRHRRQLHGPRYVHTGGDTGRHGHHDGYELVRVRVVAGRPGRRADRALSAQGGAPPSARLCSGVCICLFF